MALLRGATLFPINSVTVDTGGAIDIRALDDAQGGASDFDQSVTNSTQASNSERTFDPDNVNVAVVNNAATTLGSVGWAVPLAEMDPGDARCTTRLVAQTCTVSMGLDPTGTGVGAVGANDVYTPRASLWKWNTSTNTGTLIVGGSGSAQTVSAALAYTNTPGFTGTVVLSVPLTTFGANEVLLLQLGCNVACGAGLLGGARSATWRLVTDDAGTNIVFSGGAGTSGLTQSCAQANTGASTPTAVMVRRPGKLLVSSSTPTSTISRLVTKFFIASTTPTGALTKQPSRFFTGSTTPTGALLRRPGKLLASSITPGPGTVTRRAIKLLTSSITPTSTISRLVNRFFTSSTTPTGTVFKTPSIRMSGSITPGPGSLLRRPVKLLTSSTTPTGQLLTLIRKNFVSSLPLSGALVRMVAKPLTGSTTPTGTVLKTPRKFLTGIISGEGGGSIINIFRRIVVDD